MQTKRHIEVCCKKNAKRLDEMVELESELKEFLRRETKKRAYHLNTNIYMNPEFPQLYENIEYVLIDREWINAGANAQDEFEDCKFHFYRLQTAVTDMNGVCDDAGDGETTPSANHWLLPSTAFENLWENLIYEAGLKEKLLRYAQTAITFSQHKVNPHIIACNRLMLLHGPPGTGKTSLCKAIAQKLAIRVRGSYKFTHLVEINSHSLFSKWFSESGKLVMKLFSCIREMVAAPQSLVCVLIDEVESLAYARNNMCGQEPKDAMRVVNALLTQLDSIKEYPNVLILATSNLAESIDMAFLDRADIKQHIGFPCASAVRDIYASMLLEMMRVGMLEKDELLLTRYCTDKLTELATRSIGLSGRTLRRLPFLAYVPHATISSTGCISLDVFMKELFITLENHMKDEKQLLNKN